MENTTVPGIFAGSFFPTLAIITPGQGPRSGEWCTQHSGPRSGGGHIIDARYYHTTHSRAARQAISPGPCFLYCVIVNMEKRCESFFPHTLPLWPYLADGQSNLMSKGLGHSIERHVLFFFFFFFSYLVAPPPPLGPMPHLPVRAAACVGLRGFCQPCPVCVVVRMTGRCLLPDGAGVWLICSCPRGCLVCCCCCYYGLLVVVGAALSRPVRADITASRGIIS